MSSCLIYFVILCCKWASGGWVKLLLVFVIYIYILLNLFSSWIWIISVFPLDVIHLTTNNEVHLMVFQHWIRVITKLPNSEQSYKGKIKTHNYINRQNQSTTGKLWNDFLLIHIYNNNLQFLNNIVSIKTMGHLLLA
jgi:hypothetical protein